VRDAPGLNQGLSCAFGARGTSLLLVKKRSTQEKTTPRLALAGCRATAPALPQLRHPCRRPARQVREVGPGFSTAHPCAGEKESASCRFPLRGLSSPPHRRTGAPGRAARHRATAPALPQLGGPCPRHGARSVRHRCAVVTAKRQEPGARDPASCGIFRIGECLSSANNTRSVAANARR
jgi:hypothetical protein